MRASTVRRATTCRRLRVGPRSCILWLDCRPDQLDARLDARLDAMLAAGLLSELATLWRTIGGGACWQRGARQMIGLKEFRAYFEAESAGRCSDAGLAAIRAAAVAQMKRATQRYARRQRRWIATRLAGDQRSAVPVPIHRLDATDPSCWRSAVLQPALALVADALQRDEDGDARAAARAISDADADDADADDGTGRPTRRLCCATAAAAVGRTTTAAGRATDAARSSPAAPGRGHHGAVPAPSPSPLPVPLPALRRAAWRSAVGAAAHRGVASVKPAPWMRPMIRPHADPRCTTCGLTEGSRSRARGLRSAVRSATLAKTRIQQDAAIGPQR